MAHLLSVVSALMFSLVGYSIFFENYTIIRKTEEGNQKETFDDEDMTAWSWQLPANIFALSCAIILYKCNLYPIALRRLNFISEIICEVLIVIFVMEFATKNFWIPLENYLKSIIRSLQQTRFLGFESLEDSNLLEYLICPNNTPSLFLSIFILMGVIKAVELDKQINSMKIKSKLNIIFKDIKNTFNKKSKHEEYEILNTKKCNIN